MRSSEINRTRLTAAVLILFLLQTLMLPAAIGVTYASRSLRPEHILTYTAGKLVWDAGTDTDSTGAAQDQADTALGDGAAEGHAARVTLGFYLVAEEEPGQWIRPTSPKTGDRFPLGWYAGMMAVTGTALAMLGLGGRRRRSDEEQTGGKAGR